MEALLEQAWEAIKQQLESNQFLSGGATLMVFGGLVALCRNVPARIWDWIKHRAFLEFEIPMQDESFNWFNDWLGSHTYSKKWARWLTVRTVQKNRHIIGSNGLSWEDDEDDGDPKSGQYSIILSPAPGRHWLFWNGHFIVVERIRKENENGGNGQTSLFSIPREVFNVSVLTWRRSVVMSLLEAVRDFANPPEDKRVSVYSPRYGDWQPIMRCRPRPAESVVLRDGVMETLMEDAQTFLGREKWYAERGIPFRRGYMLYGPPGNGKSSAVSAIASALSLDIYVVNLGTSSLGDDELRSLFSRVPTNTVVLIEDIDCVFQARSGTKDNDSKVTFSGLLNAIDGVVASEGRLLFMTTNYIETLDAALIRPGRCDVKLLFENANSEQAARLFLRFFPDEKQYAEQFGEFVGDGNYCMAALQGHLLKYAQCPASAIHNLMELLNEPQTADQESERTQGELGVQA